MLQNNPQHFLVYFVVKLETHHLNSCTLSRSTKWSIPYTLKSDTLSIIQTCRSLVHVFFRITMNAEIQKVKMIYFQKKVMRTVIRNVR